LRPGMARSEVSKRRGARTRMCGRDHGPATLGRRRTRGTHVLTAERASDVRADDMSIVRPSQARYVRSSGKGLDASAARAPVGCGSRERCTAKT
jgi:hypothetical protein